MRVITAYRPPPRRTPPRRRRRSRRWLFLLLAFAIAAGVFWYQNGKATSPSSNANRSETETSVKPAGRDAQLGAILSTWAEAHPEHQWSMVVRELSGGSKFASYRADQVYDAASIYKLFLTYLLFREISVDQVGGITVSSQGRSWSLEHCLDIALRVSDNPCAWAIGNRTGWTSSNPTLAAAGFSATALDITNGHRSSAQDTANLLEGLYKAELYDGDERDYLINILKQQSYNQGIPAGCTGCTVANKTGDLPSVRHDAAIVYHGGKVYLLVVFTDGATYAQIAELTRQIHGYLTK